MYGDLQQSSRTNGDRLQNWIVKDWFTDWLLAPEWCCNHHNNVYWRDDRPEEIDETCLKGPKVTALCVSNAKKGKLGPYWLGKVTEEKLSNSE